VPPDEMRMRNSAWAPPVQFTLRTETRVVEVGVVQDASDGKITASSLSAEIQ
jgi:hypothetical protein